jgi:tetratricopeptide (TPR) repeat protein
MPDIDNKDATIAQQNINSNVYNQYGEKKIKKFLGSPFFSETFLGREDDLKNLHKLFTEEKHVILLNGDGGVGKTALAAQYYAAYQDYYNHLGWVFMENNLADALLTLALPLEIHFSETLAAAERLQVLLGELRNLKKPCLLVIDNANNQEELEKNYQSLYSCANFYLLLTTRITEFQQTCTFTIEGLPEDKALELFKKHYPKHQASEDEIFKQVRFAVGGNTLVLELLGKTLQLQNRFADRYSLSDLLTDLQKKGLLALRQSPQVTVTYHAKDALRKEKPESIISAMYDLGELTDTEKKLLSVFAVLPAENIEYTVLQNLLSDKKDFSETITSLFTKGWLNYNETGNSFKISPVIQEITKNKNKQLFADCEGLVGKLKDLLSYEPLTGHFINASYKEAALYAHYATSVLNDLTETNINISVLYERLGSYYKTTGNLLNALKYFDSFFQMQKELIEAWPSDAQSKNGLAIAYQNSGNIYMSLGKLEKAFNFYGLFNQLENELTVSFPDNTEFKGNLAISYAKLANVWAVWDKQPKALELYQLYNDTAKELADKFPNDARLKQELAISYEKLGDTYARLGKSLTALGHYKLESQMYKVLCNALPLRIEFKNGLAVSYEKLGKINWDLGNTRASFEFYKLDMELSQEIYETAPDNVSFKNRLAIAYQYMGNIYAATGNMDDALKYFSLYNQMEKELHGAWPNNVTYKSSLAISYIKMGYVNEKNPDPLVAKNYYQASKELFTALAHDFPDYAEFSRNLKTIEEILAKS